MYLDVPEQLAHAGREPRARAGDDEQDDIDLPAARDLWARLWPLCQFLESQSYPAAVKTACSLLGVTTGRVRPPLLPLDAAATRELSALVDRAVAEPHLA